jgi:hypothetical protein
MSDVNVILAAGQTVVALAAVGFAFAQQRRSLRHEREMFDLADVRKLLDEAAMLLHRAEEILFLRRDPTIHEVVVDPVGDMARLLPSIGNTYRRLSVRLGSQHTTVSAFTAAAKQLHEWRSAVLGVAGSTSVEEARDSFSLLTAAYLEAAVKTAGARLP